MQIARHESLKFGQLILEKSLKLLPPDVRFLRLKCTKFNFGWGSAPDPAGGAYSVPSDPLAGLRGPTSKGRGGDRKRRGGDRKGGEGRGREGEGTGRGGGA